MSTRLDQRLLRGAQGVSAPFMPGRSRALAPVSAATSLQGLPLVSFAALVQGVAAGRPSYVLEPQFGLRAGTVLALEAGLRAQGIAGELQKDAWLPAHLPLPMNRLHTWALARFRTTSPATVAACRSWQVAFPSLVLPSGPAAPRQVARLQAWLDQPVDPGATRHPLRPLLDHAHAEGGPRYWQAVMALSHVRAVALRRLTPPSSPSSRRNDRA